MKQYPTSGHSQYALVYGENSIVPKHWTYSDIILGPNPARVEPRVFFCAAHNCTVSCHAPIACNEDCRAYNARKVR